MTITLQNGKEHMGIAAFEAGIPVQRIWQACRRQFLPVCVRTGGILTGSWVVKLLREEGRMWVFIRPRGGQDYYLLMCENRARTAFCPIHRFDGTDQFPLSRADPVAPKSR